MTALRVSAMSTGPAIEPIEPIMELRQPCWLRLTLDLILSQEVVAMVMAPRWLGATRSTSRACPSRRVAT